jgi:hypothetical protein
MISFGLWGGGGDISDYSKENCIIHEACTMLIPAKEKKKKHKDWFDSAKQALLTLLAKRREAHMCENGGRDLGKESSSA